MITRDSIDAMIRECSMHEEHLGARLTDAERDDIWKHRDEYLGRVVDVTAQEITKDGRMRHPRSIGRSRSIRKPAAAGSPVFPLVPGSECNF